MLDPGAIRPRSAWDSARRSLHFVAGLIEPLRTVSVVHDA